MNDQIFIKLIYSFFLLLLVIGCQEDLSIRLSEFENHNIYFDTWEDHYPYQFSASIRDSIEKINNTHAAWAYSNIGDIQTTLRTWDKIRSHKTPTTQSILDSIPKLIRHDAVDYIASKADSHRIVIINEAHHMPQHRVFTTRLLSRLHDIGYNSLGLEAYFSPNHTDSSALSLNYPTFYSGSMTKEPQYGNMVRKAKELSYTVFAYESRSHKSNAQRDSIQAENIKAHLSENPNNKVIIHCGFAHVYEGEIGGEWGKAMASRLFDITGLNPLTIDQVGFSERYNSEFEHPLYRELKIEEASIYRDSSNIVITPNKGKAWVDIAVFHPRSKSFNRPQWLLYDDRKTYHINFENAPVDCPCIIMAYKKGEDLNKAIPYDIQESQHKNVKLVLDESPYVIVIWSHLGNAVKSLIKNTSN